MGWLTGWTYRKSVTLSRASGAVTNYPLKLLVGESSGATGEDVDCGGLCKSDFSDLRFTTSDGTTLLDYYIEDVSGTTPNQLASIWIEFDYIGTSATMFYMYYGNSGASAVSNGPNTFILFEDFNDLATGDLNGQNGWTGHTYWDVGTTTKYEGAKAANAVNGGSTVQVNKTISSGTVAYHLFFQARMRSSYVPTSNGLNIYFKEGSNQITAMSIGSSQFQALVSPPSWVNIGKSAVNNTWYKARLTIESTTVHHTWVDDTQYSPANQTNMNTISSTIDSIQLEHYSSGSTVFVDQLIVGQYLPTGPSWGSWGSQETESGAIIPVLLSAYRRRRIA